MLYAIYVILLVDNFGGNVDNQYTDDSSRPIKLHFGNDLDNLDEIEFKPITKGLGFHKDKKAVSIGHRNLERETLPTQKSNKISDMGASTTTQGLQKFYSSSQTSIHQDIRINTVPKTHKKKKKIVSYESATIGETFIAYIVDLFLIFGLLGITFLLLSRAVGIGPLDIVSLLPMKQGYVYLSLLFSIFYLFYFTVLDMNASPGKSLMGIRVLTIKGKRVEMRHTFTRSLVALLSLPLLCLPLAFDIQGKLSDTKLVK